MILALLAPCVYPRFLLVFRALLLRVFFFCRVGTAATQPSAGTSVIWSVDPAGLLLPRGRFARASRSPGSDLIFRCFLVPYTKDQNQIRGHPFASEQNLPFTGNLGRLGKDFPRPELCNMGGSMAATSTSSGAHESKSAAPPGLR
jgi:hypothetical protein